MKSLISILVITLSVTGYICAQAGLEEISIETYYIADASDATTSFFPVPPNAVTYRIYIDMATNWELQAIFGSTNSSTGEIDTLAIRSTMPFFNNEDRGRLFGYMISTTSLDENTVLLDSWLSTGRTGSTSHGVLKPEDTNGALPAFPNVNGLIQNNDPAAGIPVNMQDGNIPGTTTTTWTLIGMTPTDLAIFDDINLAGNVFVEADGALTSFSTPLQGPNANNRLLIGQFTTAGQFSGKLNVQLRNSITGEIQQWVAQTPGEGQFTLPSLSWGHQDPPVVDIISPANNRQYLSGEVIEIEAEASDPDGNVIQVEFFLNGLLLNYDDTPPYAISVPAGMGGTLTAIATDNDFLETISEPVMIEVTPYHVKDVEQFCNAESVCMPLEVVGEGIMNVNGIDIILHFDHSKIVPTGVLYKRNDLLNSNFFSTDNSFDVVNETMQVTVYLNENAPPGTSLSGIGELICIEFEKRPGFDPEDSTSVTVSFLQQSFSGGGVYQWDSIPAGTFNTIRNTQYFGSLALWIDGSPISSDTTQPGTQSVTTISGSDELCNVISANDTQPDLNGSFTHDLTEGNFLLISRNISDTADVMDVINSFDAFLIRKVLREDPSFIPDIFQFIAMDVNQDGIVSAGDVSQVYQRSILAIPEFKQAWNYTASGVQVPDYQPSKDWTFVSDHHILFDPAYTRSASYPDDDGIGFSRHRVPLVSFCQWTGINNQSTVCPEVGTNTYYGILLGDVNGNFRE